MKTLEKTMNRIIAAAVAAVMVIAAASCSSSRHSTATTTAAPAAHVAAKTPVAALAAAYVTPQAWSDLYVPFTLKLTSPMNFSLSGRATMVRGRSVKLSLRMLGMEIAMLYADNDSVWLIDKVNRICCSTAINRLTGNNSFNITNLQDMMLGRVFYPGRESLTADAARLFEITGDKESFLLTSRDNNSAADWSMTLTPEPQLAEIDVALPGGYGFTVGYSDFTTTLCGPMARRAVADGTAGKHRLAATLTWDLGKIKLNRGETNDWTPPTNYRRITAQEMIRVLKSL